MATFTVEIPDIATTVHREAIDSVVRNVLNHFGLKVEECYYMSAYTTAHQPNSTVGATRDLNFGNSEKVVVEVDERINPDGMNSRGQGTDNHIPIFHDPLRGIMIVPSPARYDVTITMKYRAPGRPAVNNWATGMRRQLALGGDVVDTQADFHYLIPADILNLLADIARAGNVKDPTYTLDKVLSDHFGDAVTVITNVAGNEPHFAVRCTLGRILAFCDPSADIQAEKSGDGGAWQAELQVQFQYERPEALTVYYPPVINNTLLPEHRWFDLKAPGMSDPYGMLASKIQMAAETFRDTYPISLPVYIPRCDLPVVGASWMYRGEYNVFVGYFEMEAEKLAVKPFSLEFTLDNLGDINFTPRVVEYMKQAYALDPHGQDSLFRLFIYANSKALAPELVAVAAADLQAYGNFDFNVTTLYQFGITCRTTFEGISDAGMDIIIQFPDVIRDIILDFYPWFPRIYPDIWDEINAAVNGGKFDWPTLDRIKDILDNANSADSSAAKDPEKNGMATNVMSGYIIAHRRDKE